MENNTNPHHRESHPLDLFLQQRLCWARKARKLDRIGRVDEASRAEAVSAAMQDAIVAYENPREPRCTRISRF